MSGVKHDFNYVFLRDTFKEIEELTDAIKDAVHEYSDLMEMSTSGTDLVSHYFDRYEASQLELNRLSAMLSLKKSQIKEHLMDNAGHEFLQVNLVGLNKLVSDHFGY